MDTNELDPGLLRSLRRQGRRARRARRGLNHMNERARRQGQIARGVIQATTGPTWDAWLERRARIRIHRATLTEGV